MINEDLYKKPDNEWGPAILMLLVFLGYVAFLAYVIVRVNHIKSIHYIP